MNKIEKMRLQIKNGLDTLPESNQNVFRFMYSHEDLTRSMHDIVDNMSETQLKGALLQVERTIVKRWGGPKCRLE